MFQSHDPRKAESEGVGGIVGGEGYFQMVDSEERFRRIDLCECKGRSGRGIHTGPDFQQGFPNDLRILIGDAERFEKLACRPGILFSPLHEKSLQYLDGRGWPELSQGRGNVGEGEFRSGHDPVILPALACNRRDWGIQCLRGMG